MNKLQNWNFTSVWNASLIEAEPRELKVRDNLWASELGKAPIDLFLKMRATPLTNPPNPRSMRKFEAGNVFEWIVSLILKRAGILRESQRWSSFQYPGLLKVTGKADFIAGGKPDYEKWQSEMRNLELPEVFLRAGQRIMKHFMENYPDGLLEKPLEIKSVGSWMFDAMEKNKRSSKTHRLQAFHYLISESRPTADIIYICREDLRMAEFTIDNPGPVEEEYKKTIETLTKYHLTNERPPLEQPILFDEDIGKFVKNYNIAYSGYLTMLYGFKNQKEFDDKYAPIVSRWKRVLERIKQGKDMTAKNNDVIAEITAAGYSIDEIISKFVPEEEDPEVPSDNTLGGEGK